MAEDIPVRMAGGNAVTLTLPKKALMPRQGLNYLLNNIRPNLYIVDAETCKFGKVTGTLLITFFVSLFLCLKTHPDVELRVSNSQIGIHHFRHCASLSWKPTGRFTGFLRSLENITCKSRWWGMVISSKLVFEGIYLRIMERKLVGAWDVMKSIPST